VYHPVAHEEVRADDSRSDRVKSHSKLFVGRRGEYIRLARVRFICIRPIRKIFIPNGVPVHYLEANGILEFQSWLM
jgi:hypothetical protein